MATTMIQSVVAKFAASGNTDFSASNGLWFGQIPANLPTPFLGMIHNGDSFEYTGEKNYQAYGSFLFSIYAEGVAETERLSLIVMALFDAFISNWNALDFTGGAMAKWSRNRVFVALEPIEDVNARKVGRVDIGYEYEFNGVLPVTPDVVMINPDRFVELNRDDVPLAEVEFIGEPNPEFGAQIANNLRHVTTDPKTSRRYRLMKMILEEV